MKKIKKYVNDQPALQLAFEKNYPSEILDQDSLLGPRLMALTHSQLQKRLEIHPLALSPFVQPA